MSKKIIYVPNHLTKQLISYPVDTLGEIEAAELALGEAGSESALVYRDPGCGEYATGMRVFGKIK